MMVKVKIDEDEYFPFYFIDRFNPELDKDESLFSIDIPEDKFAWIKKIMEEFEEVQDYLGELHGNH